MTMRVALFDRTTPVFGVMSQASRLQARKGLARTVEIMSGDKPALFALKCWSDIALTCKPCSDQTQITETVNFTTDFVPHKHGYLTPWDPASHDYPTSQDPAMWLPHPMGPRRMRLSATNPSR